MTSQGPPAYEWQGQKEKTGPLGPRPLVFLKVMAFTLVGVHLTGPEG